VQDSAACHIAVYIVRSSPYYVDGSMCRVGQNYIYTVDIRYFRQGNHQLHGHIRSIYPVLANPKYVCQL